jgi:hypothetical protein
VRSRDGRATVSGEPLDVTAENRWEAGEHEGINPRVRILQAIRVITNLAKR